jgi:HTH-type transcriptional regulator / antitoxin HigA
MNELRPIRTEAQHRAALKEIERLWNALPRSAEHGRLEVLATLVMDYEDRHHPSLPPDPVEAIRFRMEQLGLDRKALEPAIRSLARVWEVLSRRRHLTLEMIRRLRNQLGIPADVRVGEPARGGTR